MATTLSFSILKLFDFSSKAFNGLRIDNRHSFDTYFFILVKISAAAVAISMKALLNVVLFAFRIMGSKRR
jgi:hypothetical protein